MPFRSNRFRAWARSGFVSGCTAWCLACVSPAAADPLACVETMSLGRADVGLPGATREGSEESLQGARDPRRYDWRQSPPDAPDWRQSPPDAPDWRGVRRDIGYFLAYQFVALGVLYAAPESVSGWDPESKDDYSFSKWRDNTSKPVWDEDRWWINYVTHPYWGGAYYIQARERGLDRPRSFWYSALLSTLYEYGAESLAEPVSIQDLVVTPVAGFLVGEYLFAPLRERIRAKRGALDWTDKSLLLVTNPLGVINAKVDGWLGVDTTLSWQPIAQQTLPSGIGAGDDALPRRLPPAWGLQLHAVW